MAILGNKSAHPVQALSQWVYLGMAEFTIGAAGAVSSTDADSDITLTYAAASGDYDLTFPACPEVKMVAFLHSPAATVTEIVRTAVSATAGTASFLASKAGVATDPASGDTITVLLFGKTRG